MEEFLTVPSLARRLGVAELTVRRWLTAKRIAQPRAVIGRTRAFSAEQAAVIEAWWRERRAAEQVRQ